MHRDTVWSESSSCCPDWPGVAIWISFERLKYIDTIIKQSSSFMYSTFLYTDNTIPLDDDVKINIDDQIGIAIRFIVTKGECPVLEQPHMKPSVFISCQFLLLLILALGTDCINVNYMYQANCRLCVLVLPRPIPVLHEGYVQGSAPNHDEGGGQGLYLYRGVESFGDEGTEGGIKPQLITYGNCKMH